MYYFCSKGTPYAQLHPVIPSHIQLHILFFLVKLHVVFPPYILTCVRLHAVKKMEMTDYPDGCVINRGYLPLCSTSYYRRYSFNSAVLFFFLCWLPRGAIETLGAGRGYDVSGTEGGVSTSAYVKAGGYPSPAQPAPWLCRLPCSLWNLSKSHKKNHLYSNIPVIPFGKEGENTYLCHTTYTIHECKDKQHF